MGKIFYIIGKSATGKDHFYERLLEDESLSLKRYVLYTTRPIRTGETDGVQYHFTNQETFEKMRQDHKVIEFRSYDTVHGIWTYYTADSDEIDLEQNYYLGIGTLESYDKMKQYYGEQKICPIYIEVEDGERLERALNREKKQAEPHYEEMCRRFLADAKDFSEEKIGEQDIQIRFQNVDFEVCLLEIKEYMKSTWK